MNMKELVTKLNAAAKAYCSEGRSILSDKEYDRLYEELVQMEKERGIIFSDSPTQRVGYRVVSALPKIQHEFPALSLDKTKDRDKLRDWLGRKRGVLSYKLDGLTLVATYDSHRLVSLATRGNGRIGEDVTHNSSCIANLPAEIPYGGHLIVRGEAVISYDDFQRINQFVQDHGEEGYANPRNLASSSVRLLDTSKTAKRCLQFIAFSLVNPYIREEKEFPATEFGCFEWLERQGFHVVPHALVSQESFKIMVDSYSDSAKELPYPTDGLVLTYNDIDRTLGSTGKYPRYSMAFKWADNTAETILRDIEWSASKTGLLNPVAVFDPVELEGTTVQRASLHNVSYIKKLNLNIGDTVTVYKANMIIPQLDENLTGACCGISFPENCPVCGNKTELKKGKRDGTESLYCTSPDCPAKHVGKFERLVHRDALNITGISTATLQTFIDAGHLEYLSDIFHLRELKYFIIQKEGFGEKSYDNMIQSIEKGRRTTFQNLFYSLGIPGAGHDVAKLLDQYFSANLQPGQRKSLELIKLFDYFPEISGIGPVLSQSIKDWFATHEAEYLALCDELIIEDDVIPETKKHEDDACKGLTFVITGSLYHYKNRAELKKMIEYKGGKVSGSVSKNTDYLINNDTTSTSGKNKKAKELHIPVISEEQFIQMYDQEKRA